MLTAILLGVPRAASPSESVVAPSTQITAGKLDPALQVDNPLNPYWIPPSSRGTVQDFSREDIEAFKPRDVYDLLRMAAGVLPLRQGRKMPFTLLIRGDTNFAFIVDGVYLPDQSAGRVLNNLPVSSIEQLSVVRDATVLTLAPLVNFVNPSAGPNDGFIVIRTRRPVSNGGTLRATAESYDTWSASVFGGVRSEVMYAGALGAMQDTNGRPDEYMASTSRAVLGKAGVTAERWDVDATAYHDRTVQQIQAAQRSESNLWPQRWSFDPIDTDFAAGALSVRWSDSQSTLLTVGNSHVQATLLQGSVQPFAPNVIANEESIGQVDLKHTLQWGHALIRVGGQYLHWNTPTGQSFYEGIPREEKIWGYFLHGQYTFLTPNVTLEAAYREDNHYVVRGIDKYQAVPTRGVLPVIEDKSLPASRYYSLGAAWRAQPQVVVSARAYRAHQGDLTGIATADGKQLDPEEQTKYELGLAVERWSWFMPTLTAFESRVHNAKTPVRYLTVRGFTTPLFDQIDTRRAGFELVTSGTVPNALGLTQYTASWTYLSALGGLVDSGRTAPRNLYTVMLQHQWRDWIGNISAQHADVFYSNFQSITPGLQPIGDYTRLDASIGRRFALAGVRATLSLYARNLTDERYETQLGFPDPGRAVGVELLADF